MHSAHRRILERLSAAVAVGSQGCHDGEEVRLAADRYRCPDRFERERALCRRLPRIVGHASQLADPGDCLVTEEPGVPVIVTRDRDGELRAFLNACRHRGTELVSERGPCRRKAFVCPYHGWTYRLDGRLRHVPLRHAFPNLMEAKASLVEVPVSQRQGLIWVTGTPGTQHDIDAFLGPIGEELDALGLEDHVVFRRAECERRANWKLLVDAFLEGYHIWRLHQRTLKSRFLDAVCTFESVGPHVRAGSARAALGDEQGRGGAAADLRAAVTLTYFLFPGTTLVFHPDHVSRLSISPVAVDRLRWVHELLIPRERHTEAEQTHWERAFALAERKVFQSEDLWVAERMQIGLETGANDVMTLGRLEQAVVWFHRALDASLDDDSWPMRSTR